MTKPKIFIFINNVMGARDVIGAAIAADGTYLAGHLSSHEHWLRHDMGLTSEWKHDAYKAHYPDGYQLVDLIDRENWQGGPEAKDPEFAALIQKAREEEAKETTPQETL